jgi:hypothetical protein
VYGTLLYSRDRGFPFEIVAREFPIFREEFEILTRELKLFREEFEILARELKLFREKLEILATCKSSRNGKRNSTIEIPRDFQIHDSTFKILAREIKIIIEDPRARMFNIGDPRELQILA